MRGETEWRPSATHANRVIANASGMELELLVDGLERERFVVEVVVEFWHEIVFSGAKPRLGFLNHCLRWQANDEDFLARLDDRQAGVKCRDRDRQANVGAQLDELRGLFAVSEWGAQTAVRWLLQASSSCSLLTRISPTCPT